MHLKDRSMQQVWIENTTSKHDHGGPGWEFGKCIWSPARDRRKVEGRYKIMRSVKKGDRVINCYDSVVRGTSIADGDCLEIYDRPPIPKPWGYAMSFFRVNLRDYLPLQQPLTLKELVDRHKEEIRDDIVNNRPTYYLFSWWPPSSFYPEGRVVLSQGRFLARATPALLRMLCEHLKQKETALWPNATQ